MDNYNNNIEQLAALSCCEKYDLLSDANKAKVLKLIADLRESQYSYLPYSFEDQRAFRSLAK